MSKGKRTLKYYDRQATDWLGNRGVGVPGEHYKQVLWLSNDAIAALDRYCGEWDIFFTVGIFAEPYACVIVPPKIETTVRRYLREQADTHRRELIESTRQLALAERQANRSLPA